VNEGKWFKSSRSNGQNNCVEACRLEDGGMAVRDSKRGEASPVLRFPRREWLVFTEGVKLGQFDI
jgi:Domain of unknown function (DUF397).